MVAENRTRIQGIAREWMGNDMSLIRITTLDGGSQFTLCHHL